MGLANSFEIQFSVPPVDDSIRAGRILWPSNIKTLYQHEPDVCGEINPLDEVEAPTERR